MVCDLMKSYNKGRVLSGVHTMKLRDRELSNVPEVSQLPGRGVRI